VAVSLSSNSTTRFDLLDEVAVVVVVVVLELDLVPVTESKPGVVLLSGGGWFSFCFFLCFLVDSDL
jgi:hypothetical protein